MYGDTNKYYVALKKCTTTIHINMDKSQKTSSKKKKKLQKNSYSTILLKFKSRQY